MAYALTSLLDEALENWSFARRGVIDEVKNLPEGRFDFRPAPEARSVTELVQHIIESGLLMARELTRLDGDFRRQPYPKFLEEYGGPARRATTKRALLAALKSTHADGEQAFRKAGEVMLLQQIRRFDGQKGTRFAWMQHGIAHEEYHRGQLALYARLLGRVPALTKRIHG